MVASASQPGSKHNVRQAYYDKISKFHLSLIHI